MTPDRIRDFAERYTAAWCSQDPARVAAFFSPHGLLSVNGGHPRPALDVARAFMADFPDLHLVMDDVRIHRDNVEYYWTLTGTHAGTRAQVRLSGFEEWIFGEDGLVRESQGHFDAADYERQLRSGIP